MSLDQISTLSPLALALVGAVLLFAGRKLFWLFVAVVGFLVGMQFGAELTSGNSPAIVLAASIVIGLLAAILSVFLQRLAIALAGGAAGGLLAMRFVESAGFASPFPIVAFLVVGIAAAIVAAMLFDWALIILSALIGALMIADVVPIQASLHIVVVLVLAVVGVAAQAHFRPLARSPD